MFSWLLNMVETDNNPELTINGLDYQKLTVFLVIIIISLIALLIFFFTKYNIIKEKYEELQIKDKQDKENNQSQECE